MATPQGAPDPGQTKTDARDSRLSMGTLRKNNEEVLRRAMRAEAQKKCDSKVKAFGECARQQGLMVVINCREQNKAMSSCMDEHYNEEIFRKFLSDNGYPPPQPPRSLLQVVDMDSLKQVVFGSGKKP